MRHRIQFSLLSLSLLFLGVAHAGVVQITLDSDTQSAFPGDTLTFTGTLANLDTGIAYNLNSCDVSLGGQFSTDCIFSFLLYAPFSLDPAQTYPLTPPGFPMFTVTVNIPYTDPPGPQTGFFDVLGNSDGSENNFILGSTNFTVNVLAPEPAAVLLAGLGLAGLVWRSRH
jgi:hypothetical protein